MSDRVSSVYIGKSENYFAVLKHKNPELYEKYKSLGKGDLGQGYLLFSDKYEELREKACRVYYAVYEHPWLILQDLQIEKNKKFFNSSLSHRNMLTRYLFQQNTNVSTAIKRYEILDNLVKHFHYLIGETT